MNSVRISGTKPAVIRRKIALFKELYGAEPHVYVSGTLDTRDGDGFFSGGRSVKAKTVGRKYLHLENGVEVIGNDKGETVLSLYISG